MAYFRTHFCVKAQVIISVVTILQNPTDAHTVRVSVPEISEVLDFLQNVISPYISTHQRSNGPKFKSTRRTENLVEQTVLDKVAELKPYLQDDDTFQDEYDNDNLKLEGRDETTIIEFLPNPDKYILRNRETNMNTLKNNVNKYKDMRKTIKKSLMKEKVSEKTTKLVINTLDDMIARILENKCIWKNSDSKYTQDRVDRTNNNTIDWYKEWSTLVDLYSNETAKDNELFFQRLYKFLDHVFQDAETIVSRFRLLCQVANPPKSARSHALSTRMVKKRYDKKKHNCDQFTVCSEELSQFMLHFYYTLNDTTVGTIKNYAAMFVRDVNIVNSRGKENITKVLYNIGGVIEHKVSKIFRKETRRFQLDKNKDEAENIEALKEYVKKVIADAKKYIVDTLKTGFEQLIVTLIEDLAVSYDIDLSNLENDILEKICTEFSICNGESRRRNMDLAKDSLHVQVKIDDDLEESNLNDHKSILPKPKTHIILDSENAENYYKLEKKDYLTKYLRRNFKHNLNVTRTTYAIVNGVNSTLSYQTTSKS